MNTTPTGAKCHTDGSHYKITTNKKVWRWSHTYCEWVLSQKTIDEIRACIKRQNGGLKPHQPERAPSRFYRRPRAKTTG